MTRKTRLKAASMAALLASAAWIPNADACSSDPYLGSICIFGGNFSIRNYAFTDGQLLPISQNTALFSLLGTIYGGDGRTTFALPDTRGRVIVGPRNGPGLSPYQIGQRGGSQQVVLTVGQLPPHSHSATTTVDATATAYGQSATGNADGPGGNSLATKPRSRQYSTQAPNVAMHPGSVEVSATASTTVGNTGGGQPVDVRQPYIAINYLIALQGIYPSRN